jgi:hypothetical protein
LTLTQAFTAAAARSGLGAFALTFAGTADAGALFAFFFLGLGRGFFGRRRNLAFLFRWWRRLASGLLFLFFDARRLGFAAKLFGAPLPPSPPWPAPPGFKLNQITPPASLKVAASLSQRQLSRQKKRAKRMWTRIETAMARLILFEARRRFIYFSPQNL